MEINTNEGVDPRKETSYVRACLHHPASGLAVFTKRQLYANRRRLRSIGDVDNEGPVNYVGCRLAGKHLGIGAWVIPSETETEGACGEAPSLNWSQDKLEPFTKPQ